MSSALTSLHLRRFHYIIDPMLFLILRTFISALRRLRLLSCSNHTQVPLSEQHHLLRLHKVTGNQAVEVDTARDSSAPAVFRRPSDLFSSLGQVLIHDGRNKLTLYIIYGQLHMNGARQVEPDRRRRIERIGSVLVKSECLGYRWNVIAGR